MTGLRILGVSLAVYLFALVCGAFSYFFVGPSTFGILARDSIVGLCAVSLPVAALVALMSFGFTRRVHVAVDIFGAVLIVLASAASGFGGLIFSTPLAGLGILTGMLGGLLFVGVGCLLSCLFSDCTGDSESRAGSSDGDGSTTTTASTHMSTREPEESR